MGCSHSKNDSELPTAQTLQANPAAPIVPVPTPRGLSARQSSNSAARAAASRTASNQWNDTPNAPLRRPKLWRSNSRTWTKSQLAQERNAFWDTRVTGRPESWAALRLAVDMGMRQDLPNHLKEAQAILDAAALTTPTGRLEDGVWDESGQLYKMPRWVVSDPMNLVAEITPVEDDGTSKPDIDGSDDDEEGMDSKMKSSDLLAPSMAPVTLRARLSDRGSDVEISVHKMEKAGRVVQKISAAAKLDKDSSVRLAYMGKVLKDTDTLEASGWTTGHIMNALVFKSS